MKTALAALGIIGMIGTLSLTANAAPGEGAPQNSLLGGTFATGSLTSSDNTVPGIQSFSSTPDSAPSDFTVNAVGVAPEPGSLALLLPVAGVAAMMVRKRRK